MSAEGQGDSPSLGKEDDASATTVQPGVPKESSQTEAGISSHTEGVAQNTPTFLGVELEPFDEDIETVIEKKLSAFDKDKGPDIDSELDFELKWDDDDNQSAAKIDARLEPGDEANGDDDPLKISNAEVAVSKSDETPDMEQKTTGLENVDKPELIEQLDDVIDKFSEADAEETDNIAASEEKPTDAANAENSTHIDTNAQIDLDSTVLSGTSENSSFDEHLVYSDVEVPEIEDKELMDELDAHICDTDPNEAEKDVKDEMVSTKPLLVPESDPKKYDDAGSSQQTTDFVMDVDEVTKLDSPNDKSDPSDTLSSTNDLETSSYEINIEHKLSKPDVMLEIPTQELIESFDDSEMSEGALEYDEDVLLNNDATNNDPVMIEDKVLPINKEIIDEIPNSNESNANIKDKTETVSDNDKERIDTDVTKQSDILQMEGIEIETKHSVRLDEVVYESDSDYDNFKTTDTKGSDDSVIELMDIDEESHADIILEASHLEPNQIETEVASHITDEPTAIVEKKHVKLAPEVGTEVIEIISSGEIEPIVSMDIKKVEIEPNVVKETYSAVQMEPEMDVDAKTSDLATDLEPKLVSEAMEVVPTSETAPKDTASAKQVISTADMAVKLFSETMAVVSTTLVEVTGTTDAKEAISTAKMAENEGVDNIDVISTSKLEPEEVTATKEDISTNDEPLKGDAEDKMDSSVKTSLEELAATKKVIPTADVPPKKVSKGITTAERPPKTDSEAISTLEEPPKKVSESTVDAGEPPKKVSESTITAGEPLKKVLEVIPTAEVPPKTASEAISTVEEPPKKVSESTVTAGEPLKKVSEGTVTAGEPLKKVSEGTVTVGEPLKKVSEDTIAAGEPLKKVSEGTVTAGEPMKKVSESTVTADEPLKKVSEGTVTVGEPLKKVSEGTITAGELLKKVSEGTITAGEPLKKVSECIPPAKMVSEVIPTAEDLPEMVSELTTTTKEPPKIFSESITSTEEPPKMVLDGIITAEESPKVVSESISTSSELPKNVSEVIHTAEESPKNVSDGIATVVPAPKVLEAKSSVELEPEVAKETEEINLSSQTKDRKEASFDDLVQPSTSKYMQESSDEDQEATDSLGLLAESSRVMDDDDEQEDDDEDDEFDQDDESNHMTAEHSEDSNAQHSETEAAREAMDVDEKEPLQFKIAQVMSAADIEVLAETEVLESMEEGLDAAEDGEVEQAVKSLLEVETEETKSPVSEAVEGDTDDAVKLSEDPARDDEAKGATSKLQQLLLKGKEGVEKSNADKTSPTKTKKLEISKPKNEISIVELEESSSEDDIQEVPKPSTPQPEAETPDVTTVNIPDEVEVMSASAGTTSDMRHGEGEVVISGLPKPPPQKLARLNTDEVTIKTAATVTESLVIPEAKIPAAAQSAQDAKVELGLEIFSLDSDDEEKSTASKALTAVEIDKTRATGSCINVACRSPVGTATRPAGATAVAYYGGRRGAVCRQCDTAVTSRGLSLIEGIKDFTPLLSLDMGQTREDLVEISDSDSEEESSSPKPAIGEIEANFLDEQLASMFNKTWKKYKMDQRLKTAETEINREVMKLEEECQKINSMLNECQMATDVLRDSLYDTFAGGRDELPPILIYDTPSITWCGLEDNINNLTVKENRQTKRRSSIPEPPAKRPAIPLGYTPLDSDANTAQNEPKAVAAASTDVAMLNDDDNSDISVVKLSAEAAPADLPGPGVPARPPLRQHMTVYAMRNAFGSWSRARITDVQPKANGPFTTCRVKFEHKVKNPTKVLQARCLAYEQPSDVRMTIGTRLIALFKDNDNKRETYYSGIVAEIPNPVNNYRYLVFFDDGYAQYVQHSATRLVCESAPLVWDEVHPFSRQFVREYLCSYPERPMVRVHAGQSIRTEYNGKWWDSKVLQVDASLVQVHFDKENRTEWIYRGSTRLAPLYWELQAAERQRARPLPRAQPGKRFNMPYVEYTRSDEPAPPAAAPSPAQIEQDIRRQRAVAKKSTAGPPPPPPPAPLDGIASRVVYYTPKKTIKPHKMVPHTCGPQCRRTDVLALKDLRTYNPLTKPLLSGWERQIVKYKWSRSVMYRAPCGRRLRSERELHRYLQLTASDMAVDLFDFGPNTHCLAEFVLTKCRISKKDLSHGKENVPVPCVNYYDDSLPEFCSYNTERTPTAGVPLNLDPAFLCGCDCTDDCADKSKCACWKMTLEGARTIGLDSDEVGYVYKRLPEPLPSGIYECNSRCKCRQTCLNRVAQHPLQLKLQVFKTLNRGWGIRALNDIPKGAFLCVYAGNLLTDATANLDGLNEGDEYLAELDYIEVVEQMKEGFEEDVPDADKKLDKKESGDQDDSSTTTSSSEEEEDPRKNADDDDDDFRPTLPLAHAPSEFSKRLRKREKKKKDDVKDKQKEKDPNHEDNCITISDDEELREPARFAAQAGMGNNGFVSKYKSVRAHFGKDEACYIMDAKVQGNIGRYLNHSCTPNVFVQNVFVDTHDPRFPWVAFFALSHIRAGTELTWNYNYDVGSVPGKVLYCHCAAPNCRGRLL